MLSKALGKYPQYRFKEDEKRLWNPIEKKTYADLPEERVRLSLVEYLTDDLGLSSSRISFESPVKLQADKSRSRTDLIFYNNDFKPELLIECKAPSVKLTEKASIQIARYNEKVNARYLLISNGLVDHWFKNGTEGVSSLAWLPEKYEQKEMKPRNTEYWENRGFIGNETDQRTKDVLSDLNEQLFRDPVQPIKYLDFAGYPIEYALSHYYRIYGIDQKQKLAFSIASNFMGRSRLNIILNVNGSNIAFATSEVDSGQVMQGKVQSKYGLKDIELSELIKVDKKTSFPGIAPQIAKLLQSYS